MQLPDRCVCAQFCTKHTGDPAGTPGQTPRKALPFVRVCIPTARFVSLEGGTHLNYERPPVTMTMAGVRAPVASEGALLERPFRPCIPSLTPQHVALT